MGERRIRKFATAEEFEREIKKPEALHIDVGIYYWVWGAHKGRRVILGPFYDEDSAYREGFEQFQSDFEVLKLNTRSEVKASRVLRAMVLERTRDLDDSFRRFRHRIDSDKESDNK